MVRGMIPHHMSRARSRRYFPGSVKGRWWREKRDRLFAVRGGVCEDCGRELSLAIAELHHVLPMTQGGRDVDMNLILLCEDCHKERHGRK
jgi:5-methylcytosine-specific restriction protein A